MIKGVTFEFPNPETNENIIRMLPRSSWYFTIFLFLQGKKLSVYMSWRKELTVFYKVAKTDGFDFHTGKTINYQDNIGKTVKCPNQSIGNELCSHDVIHASEHFFQALRYGRFPCSIFVVSGEPVKKDTDKLGFKSFKVIKEIPTTHWNQAYYSTMIYILQDVKKNFDNMKSAEVTKAIDQTIQVFINAQKTGKIDESAAESAEYAARSAEYAARSARSAAESAARSAESAARSARSAEYAARSAKYKEYSDKFIEYLEKHD